MKKFTFKAFAFGLAGIFLMGCEKEIEQTEPLTVSQDQNFGTDPTSCEIIEFNDVDEKNNTVYVNGTPVRFSAQRNMPGMQLIKQTNFVNARYMNQEAALIFDTYNPTGKDKDFRTPSPAAIRPMGKILTIGNRRGNSSEIHEGGGRIQMDFSAMGSIELKGIHVLDIEEDEAGSYIELIGKDGNVIRTLNLPVTGARGATRLRIDEPGVTKFNVVIESVNKRKGSGAIDVIEFCPEV